jgi:hypothetical protein
MSKETCTVALTGLETTNFKAVTDEFGPFQVGRGKSFLTILTTGK